MVLSEIFLWHNLGQPPPPSHPPPLYHLSFLSMIHVKRSWQLVAERKLLDVLKTIKCCLLCRNQQNCIAWNQTFARAEASKHNWGKRTLNFLNSTLAICFKYTINTLLLLIVFMLCIKFWHCCFQVVLISSAPDVIHQDSYRIKHLIKQDFQSSSAEFVVFLGSYISTKHI